MIPLVISPPWRGGGHPMSAEGRRRAPTPPHACRARRALARQTSRRLRRVPSRRRREYGVPYAPGPGDGVHASTDLAGERPSDPRPPASSSATKYPLLHFGFDPPDRAGAELSTLGEGTATL